MIHGNVPTFVKYVDAKTVVWLGKNPSLYWRLTPTTQSTAISEAESKKMEMSNKTREKNKICEL